MGEITRVLIVEDLPTDAELSERELRKALGACELRRVETREAYLAALDEFRPALIVSDYRLPHFDGMTALRLAVERCPDVPFIILTGSMNEDTAVECMKAGAWDYVIKEHVKRLGPAVESALERQRVQMGRKRAEGALRDSEAQLRAVLDAAPFPVALVDVEDDKIEFWSRSALALFGHTAPTALEWYELAYPDPDYRREVIERWKPVLEKARSSGQTVNAGEYRVTCQDGSARLCELYASFLPGRLVVTFNDITERRRAEESVVQVNTLLQRTFDAIPDLLTVHDRDLRVVLSNWHGRAHVAEEERNSKPHCYSCYMRRDQPCEPCPTMEVLRTGAATTREVANPFTGKILEVSAYPVTDASGAIYLVTEHVRDITERKRAEAELAAMNTELERRVAERTAELTVTNQELESFAYAVSHDLRAPLRGIDGWSQAVMEDYGSQLDERSRTYLTMVRSETRRMDELIDNLLELSRVTRAPMKRKPIDLTAMAQEVEASLRTSQPERVVDFVVAPGMVAVGDAVLLRAVLQNLLGNAWKFTGKRPRARIEVGCTSEPGRTVYHVRDDGVGFDMRFADKLFAPFQRLHSLEEFPGTGIGLATVQRIIHRHDGKVWATAELDRGATFYFSLTA